MYKNRFLKVVDYCEDNNMKVIFYDGDGDACYPATGLICINRSQSWKKRLFALLHEVGHIQIYRNKENWEKDFSVYACSNIDGRIQRSKKFQVSLIAEEIDAWRIGRQIAKDINVFIDSEEYINMMNRCVFTYIQTAPNKINS